MKAILRYEVFQQTPSRNHFTVFAVWKDRKSFDSHETKTYIRGIPLGPMLGAPYDERLYKPL
jgi:quinol monooxygenase YgiN